MGTDVDEELYRIVTGIGEEIEAAADGKLYRINGEEVTIDDMDEWKEAEYAKKVEAFKKEHPERDFNDNADNAGDAYEAYDSYEEFMEDEIGTADDIDEPEPIDLTDYVDSRSLGDIRFEVDMQKDMIGAKCLFFYGGPNVWVHDDRVCGYWGGRESVYHLSQDASYALYEMFESVWDRIMKNRMFPAGAGIPAAVADGPRWRGASA